MVLYFGNVCGLIIPYTAKDNWEYLGIVINSHQPNAFLMSELKAPSVGNWMITLLIMTIPIVNFVALIYWASSGSSNPIKANFAKAAILWLVVIISLSLLFVFAFFGSIEPVNYKSL